MASKKRPASGNPLIGTDPDLFLDENKLADLAKRMLGGRLPPNFKFGQEEPVSSAARQKAPPAQSPAVAQNLARELEARGWTYRDLAQHLRVSPAEARALVRGGARINRPMAEELARVFATSPELWLGQGGD